MNSGEKVYCLGLKSRFKEKFPDLSIKEFCQIFRLKHNVVADFLNGIGEYIPGLAQDIEKLLKEPVLRTAEESEFIKKYFLKNFNPITTNYNFIFGYSRTKVESILNGHYYGGRTYTFYKTAYLILKEELSRQEQMPKENNDKVLEIIRKLKMNSPEVLAVLKNIYTAIQQLED